MPDTTILNFYRHVGTDHRGRTLRDIRGFSLDSLEEYHDFIQWLFPLPDPSSASLSAPLLTAEDQGAFAADPVLRAELLVSFGVMLKFYGLELDGTAESPQITPSPDFDRRRQEWLEPWNHNFLRITRMLRSLTLLGCRAYAVALLDCLERLYTESSKPIGPRTIEYWRQAVVE